MPQATPVPFRSTILAWCMVALAITALAMPLPAAGRASAPAANGAPRAAAVCTTSTVTLYDAGLGGTPDTQGMSYQAFNSQTFVVSATQTFSDGVTILDTMPRRSDFAGYFGKSTLVPALDRTSGYTLTFDVQLIAEEHSNNDRAGLSVIVLSSDTKGIELGFWGDTIWAQEGGVASTLFTHAEEASFTTTTGLISYTLAIQGDTYRLAANGAPTLSGPLRDYSAFTGPIDPYETPNFIFLGDDTSSARAKIRLATLSVAIPECTQPRYPLYLPFVNTLK